MLSRERISRVWNRHTYRPMLVPDEAQVPDPSDRVGQNDFPDWDVLMGQEGDSGRVPIGKLVPDR